MTAGEATVVAAAEDAIVAAEAEEAIKDKNKSSHRLIGGSNKDEGSDNDSGSVFSRGDGKFPATALARVWWLLRRGGGSSSETVGWWLENSSE